MLPLCSLCFRQRVLPLCLRHYAPPSAPSPPLAAISTSHRLVLVLVFLLLVLVFLLLVLLFLLLVLLFLLPP